MCAQTAYYSNLSTEEFLFMAFLLMKNKVNKIYLLATKEILSLDETKERYEMSSEVLESLRLLQGSLDPKSTLYKEQMSAYNNLQTLILKGNDEDPLFFKKFISLLPEKNIS